MKYCHDCGIPPAQSWAWNRAEEAYNEQKDLDETQF